MYVVQISDRRSFANAAKDQNLPVTVVRTPTVVPVQRSSAVVMHPALAIDYALEFLDPTMGPTRWTFREIVLTDERGEAPLAGSLLATLDQNAPHLVRLVHRSGSI